MFGTDSSHLETLCMVLISYSSRETLALSAASSTTSRRQSKSLGLMVAEIVRPETLMLPIWAATRAGGWRGKRPLNGF